MEQRNTNVTETPGASVKTWHAPPRAAVGSASTDAEEHVWVVVLAGGSGTRLQQFIRTVMGTDRPKQFCRIVGTRSMLRHTWDRARRIASCDRCVTVITAGQERHLDEETAQGVPGRVLVQPANKETAPGLLLPLLWIAERDPSATVVVFPSDHFIWEEGRFLERVMGAVSVTHVLTDKLVIVGVEADGPEQGYGWIGPAHPMIALPSVELYRVHSFWEKPDRSTAGRLYDQGYLWNTLVLIGRVDAFLRLMEQSVPEIMRPLQDAVGHLDGPKGSGALVRAYQQIRPTNLSYQLLARRSDALAVLAARHVYWSDWGDPHRVLRALIRFDRRPSWLPAYARALMQGADVL